MFLRTIISKTTIVSTSLALLLSAAHLGAATLCVNSGGTGGCFSKINDAVSHANANDTINVAAGTYTEDVVIGKSLSLVGTDTATAVINAAGLGNGIYIDGLDNAGLSNVVVTGFTVTNAVREGILITNASGVTILSNYIYNNNQGLVVSGSSAACPTLPSFEPATEQSDCGEGLHLSAVDHSVIAKNVIASNSGGILITDDTGATHDNVISQNTVEGNPYACGITLAAHSPAGSLGTTATGVYHNTVWGNLATKNGVAAGGGAGVGLFTPAPGTATYSNVIIGNTLINNGLPGVAMHSHAPGQNLNDNMIVVNTIYGNGADTEDAATTGPTGINVYGVSPVTGTMIVQNTISKETVDVTVNTAGEVRLHLNDLLGKELGVDNIGSGTVDASENWWGCLNGPNARACSNVGGPAVLFTPSATSPLNPK